MSSSSPVTEHHPTNNAPYKRPATDKVITVQPLKRSEMQVSVKPPPFGCFRVAVHTDDLLTDASLSHAQPYYEYSNPTLKTSAQAK